MHEFESPQALLTLVASQHSVSIRMFEGELDAIRKAFDEIKKLQYILGFELLPKYTFDFTRIGTGGSYFQDGRIIIAATDDGMFFTRTPGHHSN